MSQPSTAPAPEPDIRASAIEALTALFALGREVTSVLDLEELLKDIITITDGQGNAISWSSAGMMGFKGRR